MILLQKQWAKVTASTNEIDLTFILLRVLSLVGGIAWILVAPLAPGEKNLLVKSLIFFAIYSILCYLIIFYRPSLLKKVYLLSLFLDIIFLSNLVHAATNFEDSFFIGYYLLICLHTIYFGMGFGLIVAIFSAISYGISILPIQAQIEWTDLALRMGFFFFITIPVGLLTEKVKREKEEVEHFNRTLETKVAKRTDKIEALLDQERYLREILNTVAHVNKLFISAPNVVSLLKSSCDRFVQHDNYGFSWIGLLEKNKIQTFYTSGTTGSPIITTPYDVQNTDDTFYHSSAAQCIRDNQTVIRKKSQVTPNMTQWLSPQMIKGFQAIISLPLRAQQSSQPLGAITIYTWREEGFEPEEKEMLDELAGDIGFAIDSFRQKESVSKLTAERTANYEETIFSFADMIEQRDTYTAGHTERVAQYCQLIAKEMGLEFDQIKVLYKSAILHDIGKIATPDSVLLKPGKLTELDYDLIKLHAVAGYEMLSAIEMYKDLAVIILHHHERHDGKGYPKGLQGDEIPLLSRVMSVGDAFDAMTTNRIYKSRKDIPEALAELQDLSGSQFNPEVVKAAIKALADVKVSTAISQLPATEMEKKRFSYFFNDRLTGLYNEDYLKIILNDLKVNQYTCLHILHLLNVSDYNKQHGWAKGNQLFKEFATELQADFLEALIFRVYGNDFAVVHKDHIAIKTKRFETFKCLLTSPIWVEVQHIDLFANKTYTIDKLDKLDIRSSGPRQPQ